MSFLNVSSCLSVGWSLEQLEAAKKLGKMANGVVDVLIPEINPQATMEEITALAEQISFDHSFDALYCTGTPDYAMVEGDSTLTVALVKLLQDNGWVAFSPIKDEMGRFIQFREFPRVSKAARPTEI